MLNWYVEVSASDDRGDLIDISVRAKDADFNESIEFGGVEFSTALQKTAAIKMIYDSFKKLTDVRDSEASVKVRRANVNNQLASSIQTSLTDYME